MPGPLSTGGALLRRDADGSLQQLAADFTQPDDVTRDDAGNVYVSDRGLGLRVAFDAGWR